MILNQSLRDYAQALASREPVPGGGSAACYVGSLGAALLGMTIAYSQNRKGVTESHAVILREGAHRMERLREEFLLLSEKDCEAYGAYSRAKQLPRSTPEEKRERRKGIQMCLEGALQVPLKAASLCLEGLQGIQELVGLINPHLITDVGVALECMGAAFRSSWYNVEVNGKALKNPVRMAELEAKKAEMEARVAMLEVALLEKVKSALT